MAQDNVLGIQATINGKDIKQGANEFIGEVNRMEKAADKLTTKLSGKARMINGEVRSMGDTFSSLVNTIAKGAAAMGVAFSAQQFITQVARTRGEFQQLEVAFNTMLGSAEKAGALMAQLTKTAAVTPFGLQDVAGGAKSLLAYGVEAEKVNDTLVRLGDIASGLSIPLNDLVYLYGTTMTQGRMFTQDLRQFQGRGIPLADELAKQFGVTKDKVGELVTAGRVGFAELEKAIVSMTSEGGKFGGLMEAQSKTIIGQWSNIRDAIDGMFNEIGKSQEGAINTALSGVSALVENYEKVGGVLATLVGTYGAYKAAVVTASAIEAVKVLGLKSGLHYTILNTKAVGALTVAQKAYNATMALSPWGIAAAGVLALAVGTYKLFTYQTDLEKATNKLNGEIAKEQNNIDSLFGKLDATKKGTKEYESAKQEIINQYGAYLKGLKDEVTALEDVEAAYLAISSAAKLAAQERAIADANNRATIDYNTQKENALGEISKLFGKNKRASSSVITAIQKDFAELGDGNISDYTKSEIQKYKGISAEILQQISYIKAYRSERDKTFQSNRKNFDEWGVLSMSESELNTRMESVKKLKKQMEDSGKSQSLVTSSGRMVFNSLIEVDSYLSALEVRAAKITEGRNTSEEEEGDTYRDAYKKAEKRWQDAVKAVRDAKKKSQKDYEKAVQELEAAESEYKKLGGDPSGKTSAKQEKAEENKAQELLNIRRENQQSEINLMKEGSEKRKKQIELDYQKDIDAYNEAVKKYGKTAEVEQMKVSADKTREEELLKLKRDNIKAELQSLYDYLKEYGTIQQQKYAIAKAYDLKIAEESNSNKKRILQKEKEGAIASADAQNLAMGIDWGTAFEGVGNVLGDIATETLKRVEEYMNTAEFKGLSAENKKEYADLRNRLREEAGSSGTSPFNFKQWSVIANQVREYQKSVQNLKDAQNEHTIAVRNLKRAEEELLTATDDTAKKIAKVKVEIAEGQVNATANKQNNAQEDVDKSKNNLKKSTDDAVKGIDNFTSALNEMGNGSLYGFANGVTKLIQTLTKGSDEAASGLSGLGKVGGIVGAILQILGALGDNPKQFFDDLLKNVADAVSNLIADLPEIIVTILERVVDIVGGVLGGIASWFGLDTAGESDKTLHRDIERLTNTNEALIASVDKLSEEMANASVIDSKEMYEQQKAFLTDSMKNTKEMMERSAKAYSNGFLGFGGNHSSGYYVDRAMNLEGFKLSGYSEKDAELLLAAGNQNMLLWNKISEVVGFSVKSADDFFALSSENMAKIARDAPEIYSLIKSAADDGHEDASQYMDEYIQYYEQLQELENQYREKITGTSFDTLKSDFKNLLMDMESDADDFAQSFEKMMKNAIVEAFILKDYKSKLQKFYTDFANAMESGGTVDETEQDALRQQWEDYASQAMAERDALWETMGWDKDTYSQEATSKEFQTMSQDTGDELNGRVTALQIASEEIRRQAEQQTVLQTLISTDTAAIRQSAAIQQQYVSEIVDIQYESVGYLSEISKNTKQLFQMNERLGKIEENTRNM